MKIQSALNLNFLVIVISAMPMTGCFNEQAYRQLEDSYRPTKQVNPMSDNLLRWDCGRDIVFESGGINIHNAELVRPDDNCSKKTPAWVVGENFKNKLWHRSDLPGETHLIAVCKNPDKSYLDCLNQGGYLLHLPNTDPNLAAVNVWEISHVSLDGVLSANKVTNEYKSERIHYSMYIVEGHKLPLGGMFYRRFPPGYMDDPTYGTVQSTFTTATGLKWKHARVNNYPKPGDTSQLYGQSEIYQADIGNYSILVMGTYEHPVYQYPDWLTKRQAFLREWLESFKIEPLPADYKKVQ
jgi:hypothetical protein